MKNFLVVSLGLRLVTNSWSHCLSQVSEVTVLTTSLM